MKPPLRDRIAAAVVTFVMRHIASANFRDRLTCRLNTGEWEPSVPVEEVVLSESRQQGGE